MGDIDTFHELELGVKSTIWCGYYRDIHRDMWWDIYIYMYNHHCDIWLCLTIGYLPIWPFRDNDYIWLLTSWWNLPIWPFIDQLMIIYMTSWYMIIYDIMFKTLGPFLQSRATRGFCCNPPVITRGHGISQCHVWLQASAQIKHRTQLLTILIHLRFKEITQDLSIYI